MPPRRYRLSDRDGLDGVFGRTGTSSAAVSSDGGIGLPGDAPFADLVYLGINIRIGEDLGMPPTDAGVERATEEMVAELLSSEDNDSEGTKSEDVARASPVTQDPSVAELLDESERALEEEAE